MKLSKKLYDFSSLLCSRVIEVQEKTLNEVRRAQINSQSTELISNDSLSSAFVEIMTFLY